MVQINLTDIIDQLRQGAHLADIGAQYGCHPSTIVTSLLRTTGLSVRQIRKTEGDILREETGQPEPEIATKPKNDPRSQTCLQIEYCCHRRCHLHWRCPAYANYVQTYGRAAA